MFKIRKIDFTLQDDTAGHEKLIFRFYPRKSSCHGFGDAPPKSWEEVYKVYYRYAIIKQCIYYNGNTESHILFDSYQDECSVIDEVAERCKLIADENENVLFDEIKPLGMGISWKISEYRGQYKIELFDWNNIGYRFYLEKDRLKEFGKYLNDCCEYMLSVGEPI